MIQEEAKASSLAPREATRDTDRCGNKSSVDTVAMDLGDE